MTRTICSEVAIKYSNKFFLWSSTYPFYYYFVFFEKIKEISVKRPNEGKRVLLKKGIVMREIKGASGCNVIIAFSLVSLMRFMMHCETCLLMELLRYRLSTQRNLIRYAFESKNVASRAFQS